MYENYYGLSAKPFQLRPDPRFFYGSQGHKRAMAYLEYGLSQREGFIVITGEVGAGKTTLMRNMLGSLPGNDIVAAQITNTYLGAEDTLRMVLAAFGVPVEEGSKTTLLLRLEQFLRQCDQQGKRALLVVDEAQNLTARAVEELRMLSNFQSEDRSLLQTFLLGQPEFRVTLHSPELRQLRQRVIATYHLGPMNADETRAYIEHRLHTVGWCGKPCFADSAHAAIHAYAGGIPRITNHVCDRLMLMGFLDELEQFTASDVDTVLRDIADETPVADGAGMAPAASAAEDWPAAGAVSQGTLDERLVRVERSMVSLLHVLRKVVAAPANLPQMDNIE
jgi:putative secretion ATPase (PEP-CTERM system associated)